MILQMIPQIVLSSLFLSNLWIAQASETAQTSNPPQQVAIVPVTNKITFDLSRLSEDGRIGSAGNARSLSYEFCIPGTEQHVAEVQSIDPTVNYFPHSRGRIGCGQGQYLCIGNTHQPQWREVLMALAGLDYVERIDEFFGE